jgi:nicotinamide riboside kinase
MDAPTRFKLAFIGSHGVGKTTLAFGLAARLKARDVSLDVVHEVARRCPLPINETTSVAAQSWILHTQIAEEVVAGSRYPVVLCDRSVLDNYVYMVLAAGEREPFETLVGHWIETYQLLVHVPIAGRLQPDGIRAADPAFQRLVEERLDRELERRALGPLRLDPGSRDGWLDAVEDAVWRQLRPAQLELL